MALDEVQLLSEQYGLSEGTYTGTRVYAVRFDDLAFDEDDILTADDGTTAIPSIGDVWAVGKAAKVIGLGYATGDDQQQVTVTVNYSSKSEDQDQTIENPLARPWQYSYDDGEESAPYFRDVDDAPVVNSAGDDFADLPQRSMSRGAIVITRNVATYNDQTAESYRNTINTSPLLLNGITYAARKIRVGGYTATGPNVENDVTFWVETIRLIKRPEGWDDLFEDRGLNELLAGKPKPILDAKNEPVQVGYPLDGAGAAKANITDAPAVLTFKPYAAGAMPV